MAGRLLLTGATGFVGHALLRRLVADGTAVVVLGRTRPALDVPFLPADLGDPDSVRRHVAALRDVDRVAHLGGAILRSSDPAADEMAATVRVNVEGTAHLLSVLPAALAGFCYTSTLDVYGSPARLPVDEDHPTRPASHYAVSKLATEHLLRVWATRTHTPLAVLRLSQVYGPGDTSAKAIPNFIRACRRGEAPPVAGDGSDTRDWVYVDDVVDAIAAAVSRRADGTWNVAGGRGTSIRTMLDTVRRLTGATAEPAWTTATRPPTHIVLDVGRARADLGWAPRVALDDGLARTIAALRDA